MKKQAFTILFGLFSAVSPLLAQPVFESNLPIIVLETASADIPDEPKTAGTMKIFNRKDGQKNTLADQPEEFEGDIGIEVRGASSAGYPQQPYAIETRDSDGKSFDVSLFGWPEEHDFVALSHFNDKAFSRNALAFQLFRDMGNWASRTQLAEVFWNGDYRGIYLFGEKIKRDGSRVDVPKCDSTGGYILKIDYSTPDDSWPSSFGDPDHPDREIRFVHVYPKAVDLTDSQQFYIQNRLFEAENALYGANFKDPAMGWRAYFDASSFVDYWLVSEVSRNNDGSKKSRYFYKDRDSAADGGRLHAGPVWDFDWAWKNIDECSIFAATDGSGWSWQINDCQPDIAGPAWYERMLEDTSFSNAVRCRYLDLRQNLLKTDRLLAFVDSTAALVADAQARHYQKWPTLDWNAGAPEVNFQPTTFEGEVSKLKNWIVLRMNWLDKNVPGKCPGEPTVVVEKLGEPLFFYPNPAHSTLFLETNLAWNAKVRCSDALGRLVDLPFEIEKNLVRVDLRGLAGGVYFFWTEDARGEKLRSAARAVVVR